MLVFRASNNSIEDVEWDYVVLTFFDMYNVSSNKIKRLSRCNGTLTYVCPQPGTQPIAFAWKRVDISNNKLKSISPYDFYLDFQIEILTLNNNEIKYINRNAFKYNSKLITLSLKHNRLSRIEHEMFISLVNLRILSLSYNKLKSIDALKPMATLKILEMEYKFIKNFDWKYIVIGKLIIFNMEYKLIQESSECNATHAEQCPDVRHMFDLSYISIETIEPNYPICAVEYKRKCHLTPIQLQTRRDSNENSTLLTGMW